MCRVAGGYGERESLSRKREDEKTNLSLSFTLLSCNETVPCSFFTIGWPCGASSLSRLKQREEGSCRLGALEEQREEKQTIETLFLSVSLARSLHIVSIARSLHTVSLARALLLSVSLSSLFWV